MAGGRPGEDRTIPFSNSHFSRVEAAKELDWTAARQTRFERQLGPGPVGTGEGAFWGARHSTSAEFINVTRL